MQLFIQKSESYQQFDAILHRKSLFLKENYANRKVLHGK